MTQAVKLPPAELLKGKGLCQAEDQAYQTAWAALRANHDKEAEGISDYEVKCSQVLSETVMLAVPDRNR